MRRHVTYANVMATIAVFAVFGGGALALGAGYLGRGGVVHGCVLKKTGALRVVKPGKRCRRGEAVIDWNHQGPPGVRGAIGIGSQGSKGDQGAPGGQGAPGAQGPAGVTTAFQTQAGEFPSSPVPVPYSPATSVASLTLPAGNYMATVTGDGRQGSGSDLTRANWTCALHVNGGSPIAVDDFDTFAGGLRVTVALNGEVSIPAGGGTLALYCLLQANTPPPSTNPQTSLADLTLTALQVSNFG
jgi:hypothetical protein